MKYIFLAFLFFIALRQAVAQDPLFTQFNNNPSYVNPAQIGLHDGLSVYLNSRNQWTKITSQFNTRSISIDHDVPCKNIGVGLLLMTSVEGEGRLRTNNLYYSFAKKIVGKDFLVSFGVQPGIVQRKIDWDELQFSDQINPYNSNLIPTANLPPAHHSTYYPDFNFGFLVSWNPSRKFKRIFSRSAKRNNDHIQIGAAVSHINQPNQAFYDLETKLPKRLSVNVKYFIPLGDSRRSRDNHLEPYFFWEKQGEFRSVVYGLKTNSTIAIGAGARHLKYSMLGKEYDAVFFTAEYRDNTLTRTNGFSYSIGMSYDFTISNLIGGTRGAFEASLILRNTKSNINFLCPSKAKSKGRYKCPQA